MAPMFLRWGGIRLRWIGRLGRRSRGDFNPAGIELLPPPVPHDLDISPAIHQTPCPGRTVNVRLWKILVGLRQQQLLANNVKCRLWPRLLLMVLEVTVNRQLQLTV